MGELQLRLSHIVPPQTVLESGRWSEANYFLTSLLKDG